MKVCIFVCAMFPAFNTAFKATRSYKNQIQSPKLMAYDPNKILQSGIDSVCSVYPSYLVSDWTAARQVVQELIEATLKEPGCHAYSWTKSGTRLFCHEAYANGDSLARHYKSVPVVELMKRLVTGPAKLDSFEVYGPAAQLAKIKPTLQAFNPIYFEVGDKSALDAVGKAWDSVMTVAQADPAHWLGTTERMFRVFDQDGSGDIDVVELSQGLELLGVPLTPTQSMALRDSIDTNRDGRVSLEEFKSAVGRRMGMPQKLTEDDAWRAIVKYLDSTLSSTDWTKYAEFLYLNFDVDKSGDLSISEIEVGLNKLLGVPLELPKVVAFRSQLDFDHDGVVSLKDFVEAIGERKDNISQKKSSEIPVANKEFPAATTKSETTSVITSTSARLTESESSSGLRQYFEIDEGFYSKMTNTDPPATLCTTHPSYTIVDWAAASPLVSDFIQRTVKEPGCLYFSWDRSQNLLTCSGAFENGDALKEHFITVGPLFNALLSGPAILERIEIHGPAAELEKTKAIAAGLEPEYFANELAPARGGGVFGTSERIHRRNIEDQPRSLTTTADSVKKFVTNIDEGFFSRAMKRTGSLPGTVPETLCSMQPSYSISNWPAAKPIVQELISATTKDPGCVYFGWSKFGDELKVREAFVDGNAAAAHLEQIKPIIEKLLGGPACMNPIEVHGPSAEVEKTKKAIASINSASKRSKKTSANCVS